MATILEQLVVLFPRAELHVIHLAIDLYPSDLDAAVAQLIGWGCDFEPESPTHAANRPQAPRLQRAATAKQSSAASFVSHQPSRTVGRWSSDSLLSWGHRPWLELYGNNFPLSRHSRLVATLGEHELAAEAQSVFSLLPDALMLQIACSCDESTVMRIGAVCRRWRQFVRDPAVWRALCLAAWPGHPAAMHHIANEWGGWKSMLFSRPRLMTEGVYVHKYMRLKLGVYEGRGMKGTVDTDFYRSQHYCYSMRYFRFLSSGRVHMLTSSDGVAEALKLMMGSVGGTKAARKYSANYVLEDTEVSFSIEARLLSHPNMAPDLHTFVFSLQESAQDAARSSAAPSSQRCRRFDTLYLLRHSCMDVNACSSDAGATRNFDTPQMPFKFFPFGGGCVAAIEALQHEKLSSPASTQYQPHQSMFRPDAR